MLRIMIGIEPSRDQNWDSARDQESLQKSDIKMESKTDHACLQSENERMITRPVSPLYTKV